MRDRLKYLIKDAAYNKGCVSWDELADYLIANGVIVPPVGIGQTVYCIRYDKARKPFVKPLEIRSITTYGIGKFSVFTTRDDTWGVTAFATEEEAEAELVKRSKTNA